MKQEAEEKAFKSKFGGAEGAQQGEAMPDDELHRNLTPEQLVR